MFWEIIFWLSLVATLVIGGLFFRDLGDVSQMFVNVKRDTMIRAIRNEKRTTMIGLGMLLVVAIAHLGFAGGPARPGMFWHVWAEYFPKTDINRMESVADSAAA